MAGRPRKPTALRVLEGNRGKRALPRNEPQPRPICPDIPEYLSGHGVAKWNEQAPRLESTGVLTEVDGDVLGMYCYAYERFMRADEELSTGRETSNAAGSPIMSPWVSEQNTAVSDMKKYGAELGLGAVSRTHIEVKKQDEDKSPLRDIIEANANRRR